MKKGLVLLLALLMLLQTLACIRIEIGSGAKPTQAAEQTEIRTEAPTPTDSPEPTQAPTPVPTASPAPKPTPELPPKDVLQAAITKLETQKNMHMDVAIQCSFTIHYMEGMYPYKMELSARYGMDFQWKPMRMKGSISLDMTDEKTTLLIYSEEQEDRMYTFFSFDDGKLWFPGSEELGVMIPGIGFSVVEDLLNRTSMPRKSGTKLVNGSLAAAYSGELDFRMDSELMEESLMLPLEGIMGFKPSETMLDALGNVPYTACVDNDSRMLVWLSLDLGEVIRPIVEQSMRLELEEEGYTLPEDLISSCVYTYTVSYSDFNEIGEIAPPDTLLAIMEELTGANT